jgi:hypothetical protein
MSKFPQEKLPELANIIRLVYDCPVSHRISKGGSIDFWPAEECCDPHIDLLMLKAVFVADENALIFVNGQEEGQPEIAACAMGKVRGDYFVLLRLFLRKADVPAL